MHSQKLIADQLTFERGDRYWLRELILRWWCPGWGSGETADEGEVSCIGSKDVDQSRVWRFHVTMDKRICGEVHDWVRLDC